MITRLYQQFERRGANLNPEQKQRLSAYNQELARLFAAFGEKLLADEQTFISVGEADLAGVPADVRSRGRGGGARAQPAGRPVRDRQHPLGGRSGADLRRQSRLARADLAGVRQSRRQWGRQRHQPDHRPDRQDPRRPRPAARLSEPRQLADAGHDGAHAGAGPGTDDAGLAGGGHPGPGGGARPAGDGAPARPEHQYRALGLSLLHGEGQGRPLQPLPGRAEALFRTLQHDQRHVPHGGTALRAQVRGDHRPDPGLAGGRAHLAGHRPRGPRRRRLLRRHVRAHRQEIGRVDDELSLALGAARRQYRAQLQQQQLHQAGRRASRC